MAGILPPALKKLATPTTAQTLVFWGGSLAVGALWLTQPFDYIKSLVAEEKK